jgi:DHA3 family multidrug efflux protein-like MFS transporter
MRESLDPVSALVLIGVTSAFNAPQSPAFAAATYRLVPAERYGRVAALNKLGAAAARLGAPFVAAACLERVSLGFVVAIDSATFLPALLLLSTTAAAAVSAPARSMPRGRVWDELREGVAAVRARPELQLILCGLLLSHFLVGSLQALVCPLVLSVHDAHTLSILLAVAALGMVLGALVMYAWKRAADPVRATLWLTCAQGVWVAIFAPQHALGLVMFGACGAMAFVPLIVGNAQAAWQTSLPAGMQGRGEGLRAMVTRASLPLSSLLVAPLADFDVAGALSALGWPLAASEQGQVAGATWLLVLLGSGVAAVCASLLFWTTAEELSVDLAR